MRDIVECKFCNEVNRYFPSCSCYKEETKKNIDRMVGCVIEQAFYLVNELDWTLLFQKLRLPEGNIFYVQICLDGERGFPYMCWRKVLEISEDEFLNNFNNANST